jgi:hypothetical protein
LLVFDFALGLLVFDFALDLLINQQSWISLESFISLHL